MGISGLLKFVKDATEPIHVKKYAGKTVAIDTYCWIHRGSFACAEKLAKNENTDQYVKYCLKFIDMLQSFHVKPILVFDGCRLPSKELVEQERHKRRKENLEKGKQFLREGKLTAARDCFTKCISVTPAMALRVIEAARSRGVDCIVAPYEADAQLAFFVKSNIAQAVITEDSDLLCYGCKNVIFKMDLTGRAQEVSVDNFGRVKNISGFTPDLFRHMCILSGCDYLPSVKGVGLVKACKALKLSKSKDSYQVASRLHQYIKGLSPVDPSYGNEFKRADKTFLYQLVFDPCKRKLKPLNEYPDSIDAKDLEFAGPYISDEKALQIALGNIDINTQLVISYFDINVWLCNYKSRDNLPSIWEASDSKKKIPHQTTSNKIFSAVSNFPSCHDSSCSQENVQMSASDVCEAVMKNQSSAKAFSSDATSSPKIKNKSPESIVANSINDLIKSYDLKEEKSSEKLKAPPRIVKSRFFATQPISRSPKEYESFVEVCNNSSSLFSDQKSSDDTVLEEILSELNAQTNLSSPVHEKSAPSRGSSSSKRKNSFLSSGESFERFSCRKKKRLNLHYDVPPMTSSEEQIDPTHVQNCSGESIPLLDEGCVSGSLFERSVPQSESCQSPLPEVVEVLDANKELDEAIPILDVEESPRKPLSVIADENTMTRLDSPQNRDLLKTRNDTSSKCLQRKLGLPSRGRFTKSPIKLKLSKYFSGSKVSGLRKKAKANQPSIKSFFTSKA